MMWKTLSTVSLLSLATVASSRGPRYDQGLANIPKSSPRDHSASIVPGKFIVEFTDSGSASTFRAAGAGDVSFL